MGFLLHQKQISIKCLAGLSVAILFGILVFGLRPKDFSFSNSVNWITEQPGIRFSKYGIAYTNPFLESSEENIYDPNSFSVEIALKPAGYHEEGFNFILALHNGKDSTQLLMGQWRSWIILMNGDDYAHKRREKRIAVNIASLSPITRFVTITTGKKGTKVYFDGQLVRAEKDLTLKIPNGRKARLIIGNSVYGRHSWKGDIYGLAVYRYTLTAQDAAIHSNEWDKDQNFAFVKNYKPFVLYFFDEKGGTRVLDHAGGNHHLEIPSRMKILEKKMLSLAWDGLKLDLGSIQDIILNLMGFIPFGFVLIATFVKAGFSFNKHGVIIAIALCFIVSLIIEVVQAWMPSRSSQFLDLALNTFGGFIGVIIYRFFYVRVCGKMKEQ